MIPILAFLVLGASPADLTATDPNPERGEVRTGPALVQKYTLKHVGSTGTLTITGIESGCGCLKPTLSRDKLQPGETSELVMTVNTLTQPAGRNTWRTAVRYRSTPSTDAPASQSISEKEIVLTLSAVLVPEITATPPALAISTAGTVKQNITITDRRSAPLKILNATSTNPKLTTQIHPSIVTNDIFSQVIEITVSEDFPPGKADETVILLTSDRQCPELRIPVRVNKRPQNSLLTTPEMGEIRFSTGQNESSCLIQIRRPERGELRIERVECEQAGFRAKWPDSRGPVATIRITATESLLTESAGQAHVRVFLAEPSGESLVILISWKKAKP